MTAWESRGSSSLPSSGRPIRVFMTNGTPLVTEIVAKALSDRSEITLVGCAENAQDAVEMVGSTPVDVVLIETGRARKQALEVTRRLRDAYPELEIIPLGVSDVSEVVQFAEAGASGYVQNDGLVSDLLDTIQSVHDKRTPCSPQVASSIFSRISELSRKCNGGRAAPEGRLSAREIEIIEQVARGLSNKEIANELNISLSTVKNHMHRILSKLGVGTRREAIASAFQIGIIDDPLPPQFGA